MHAELKRARCLDAYWTSVDIQLVHKILVMPHKLVYGVILVFNYSVADECHRGCRAIEAMR